MSQAVQAASRWPLLIKHSPVTYWAPFTVHHNTALVIAGCDHRSCRVSSRLPNSYDGDTSLLMPKIPSLVSQFRVSFYGRT